MGAPVMGGEVRGPAITGVLTDGATLHQLHRWQLQRLLKMECFGVLTAAPASHAGLPDKISWVEKFVAVGRPATEAAKAEHER